eukprot:2997637-Prorocentrum_lima.AAC.1
MDDDTNMRRSCSLQLYNWQEPELARVFLHTNLDLFTQQCADHSHLPNQQELTKLFTHQDGSEATHDSAAQLDQHRNVCPCPR